MEAVVILTLCLKENRKQGQQIQNFLLKYMFRLYTRITNQRMVTWNFIKERYQNKLVFTCFIVSFNIYKTSKTIQMTPTEGFSLLSWRNTSSWWMDHPQRLKVIWYPFGTTFYVNGKSHWKIYYAPSCIYMRKASFNHFESNALNWISLTSLLNFLLENPQNFHFSFFVVRIYDALYQGQCLDILAGYGVGPWTLRILRTYWDCLLMVEKDGRYFDHPFQGYHGFT